MTLQDALIRTIQRKFKKIRNVIHVSFPLCKCIRKQRDCPPAQVDMCRLSCCSHPRQVVIGHCDRRRCLRRWRAAGGPARGRAARGRWRWGTRASTAGIQPERPRSSCWSLKSALPRLLQVLAQARGRGWWHQRQRQWVGSRRWLCGWLAAMAEQRWWWRWARQRRGRGRAGLCCCKCGGQWRRAAARRTGRLPVAAPLHFALVVRCAASTACAYVT